MAASIGDVAARAGVSAATVSRALRGLPNVAPLTRARVLEAAAALDYVADPHASRLATGRTRTVGVVVPLLSPWYLTQVVDGAEAALAAAGYDVLLYNVGRAEGRRHFLDTLPFRKRVDGIIVIDLQLSAADQAALQTAWDLPVVLVGVKSSHFPTVTIDNVAAAATATRHLINLGHERIALLSHPVDGPAACSAALDRRLGYQQALLERGIAVPPELDVPGDGYTLHGGAEAMAQVLALESPPTAVFAESDEMAIGALKTVRDAGLDVPGDLSLVGFDDHPVAEYLGLTTVRQPAAQQGSAAARLFLDAIPTGQAGRPQPQVVLPTKLCVRRTTAPLRSAAAPAARL